MIEKKESLTLKASRTRLLMITLGNAVFAAVEVWLYFKDQSVTSLVIAGVCSILALVTAALMLPGASELTCDKDGFTIKAMFRSQRYKWTDTTEFAVGKIGLNSMVVFNFTDEFKSRSTSEKAAGDFLKNINGYEAALPANYGMNPKELSQLLNSWRTNA